MRAKVCDLDRRERLDVHARVARLEAAEHVDVVGEPQLGDAAPPRCGTRAWVVPRRVGLGEDFVEAPRVRAVLLWHARERRQNTQVLRSTHTLVGIDVLIRREAHAIAVARRFARSASRPMVSRSLEWNSASAIVARQPLAALDLARDGSAVRTFRPSRRPPDGERHVCARRTRTSSRAPRPRVRFTALLGAESRSQAGSV